MPRDSPWFRCFAENIMAKTEYRLMGLDERGLVFSMLLDCWPNQCVPANPMDLAKILGMNPSKVKKALTPRVLSFFVEENGKLYSPELRQERARFEATREKQSEGGRYGAAKKQELARSAEGIPKGLPKGQPNGSSLHFNSSDIKLTESVDNMRASVDKSEWDEMSNKGAELMSSLATKVASDKAMKP